MVGREEELEEGFWTKGSTGISGMWKKENKITGKLENLSDLKRNWKTQLMF